MNQVQPPAPAPVPASAPAGSPLDQLVSQYKQGYKTSEFWVALAVGLAQVIVASFDPNKTLHDQLSNLTWIGITYILGRSGLKVVRASTAAKVLSTSNQ